MDVTARDVLSLLEQLEIGAMEGGLSVEDHNGRVEEAERLVRELALQALRGMTRAEVAAAAIELRSG